MSEYLVSEWALIRRNELVDLPQKLEIHSDFLNRLSYEEAEQAFRLVHEMFYQMYTDMANNPEEFGFPLYKADEYDYFSKEAREARSVPWNLFNLLLCIFSSGEPEGSVFIADTLEIRKINKAKKTDILLKKLCDYGFVLSGLKKYGLFSANHLEIEYPDNSNVLDILSQVAKKVRMTQLKGVTNFYSNKIAFSNGFISWNYKILQEPCDTCTLADGCDYVADKMHKVEDRDFIYAMDIALKERGFTLKKGDPNEGPAIRYYRTQSTHDFALVSDKGKLILELRIRNAEKCMDYLQECSENIVAMFRQTNSGCQNRVNGTCKYGVKYMFECEEKWHCGCCGSPFKISPVIGEVQQYMKLVELGSKR